MKIEGKIEMLAAVVPCLPTGAEEYPWDAHDVQWHRTLLAAVRTAEHASRLASAPELGYLVLRIHLGPAPLLCVATVVGVSDEYVRARLIIDGTIRLYNTRQQDRLVAMAKEAARIAETGDDSSAPGGPVPGFSALGGLLADVPGKGDQNVR